jgi:hypothetical protein
MQTTTIDCPPPTQRDPRVASRAYPEHAPTEPAPAARFEQLARLAMRPPRLPLDLLALVAGAS